MNPQLHNILLALGSNFSAEHNIELAKQRLVRAFPGIRFSRSLTTKPIGIVSPPFVNCVAEVRCETSMENVLAMLKQIELAMGSSPEERKNGMVRIDIDLLQFDETKRKEEDWTREYIQLLLNELRNKRKPALE